MWWPSRQAFEPFGGFRGAVNAARKGASPDSELEMSGWDGAIYQADPDYTHPRVRDLELVFIAFDVLYCDGQVRPMKSALRQRKCSDVLSMAGVEQNAPRVSGEGLRGAWYRHACNAQCMSCAKVCKVRLA